MQQNFYDIFAGTYTDKTGSHGIYRIKINSSGLVEETSPVAHIRNPSYILVNSDYGVMYAASELKEGAEVLSYSINGRTCEIISRARLNSDGLCHISYSKKNNCILASCYWSGDFYSLRKDDCGIISHVPGNQAGHGPIPHAHCAVTDNSGRFALCTDLGRDTIYVYRITDGYICSSSPVFIYSYKKGSGPRQMISHPAMDIMYVVNELDSSISVFSFDTSGGKIELLQTLCASDSVYNGENYPAGTAITSDARFLYISNRGADTIAVFRLLPEGLITKTGEFSCFGKCPRHIMLTNDDKFLLISNQKSDSIVIYSVNSANGSIGIPVNEASIPAPSCTAEYIK